MLPPADPSIPLGNLENAELCPGRLIFIVAVFAHRMAGAVQHLQTDYTHCCTLLSENHGII